MARNDIDSRSRLQKMRGTSQSPGKPAPVKPVKPVKPTGKPKGTLSHPGKVFFTGNTASKGKPKK